MVPRKSGGGRTLGCLTYSFMEFKIWDLRELSGQAIHFINKESEAPRSEILAQIFTYKL